MPIEQLYTILIFIIHFVNEFDVIFKKRNIIKRLFGADQNNSSGAILLDVDIKKYCGILREFTNNTEGREVFAKKLIFKLLFLAGWRASVCLLLSRYQCKCTV